MKVYLLFFCFIVSFSTIKAQGLIFNKEAFLNGAKIERTRDDKVPKLASIKDYTPFVLSQNKSNCVAYSVAAARTILLARDNNFTGKDTISTYYFSPHWIYYRNKEDDDFDCFAGLDLEEVSEDILNHGIPPMLSVEYAEYYPWGDVELCNYYPESYESDQDTAQKFKVDDVYRLQNLEDIKLAISQGMPCVVGMLVPPSFKESIGEVSWSPSESDNYENAFGHAMVIVGYDDFKNGGSIEVMNSWGEEWGNDGYIWIPNEHFLKYTLGAYAYNTSVQSNINFNGVDSLLLKDRLLSSGIDSLVIGKFQGLLKLVEDLH